MHSFPDSSKEQLAKSTAILALGGILLKANELLLDFRGTTAALLQVIVNVAVTVGKSKSIDRRGKVATKTSLALAMLALHTGKADSVVLDLGSTSTAVFFGELAGFHLVHEQEQIVSDHFLVFILDNLLWDKAIRVDGRSSLDCTRFADKTDATDSVNHTQTGGGVFPVLTSSTGSGLGRFHQFDHGLADPRWNVRTDQTVAALPSLNRVVDILEGRRIANGTFRALADGAVLAVHAANANLSSHNLEAVGLAVARSSNIFGGSCKGLHAIASHEAM